MGLYAGDETHLVCYCFKGAGVGSGVLGEDDGQEAFSVVFGDPLFTILLIRAVVFLVISML